MAGRFLDKTVIITGASNGLGRAMAQGFASEGASIVIVDQVHVPRDDGPPSDELVRSRYGVRSLFIEADVSDEAAFTAGFRQAVREFGGVDVMVNNAGITPKVKPSIDYSLSEWARVVEVNLIGLWLGCSLAIGQMLKQDTRGKIVNISSRKGLTGGEEGRSAYCASKGGVTNLTRQLAVEYGPQGINVNAICPGFIAVEGSELASRPGHLDHVRERTPFSRLGRADDIAKAALFLASSDADFVNGHNLVVDGGALVNP